MAIKVSVDQMDDAIFKIMKEYGDVIFKATDEGVEAAAEELARMEAAATPVDTGKAKKSWDVMATKYKGVRYVGNKKRVKGYGSDRIPWTNFIEYSTKKGKPFIKRTFEKNIDRLARIVMGRIKKDA